MLRDYHGVTWVLHWRFCSVLLAMLGKCFILSYIPAPDLKLKDSRSSKTQRHSHMAGSSNPHSCLHVVAHSVCWEGWAGGCLSISPKAPYTTWGTHLPLWHKWEKNVAGVGSVATVAVCKQAVLLFFQSHQLAGAKDEGQALRKVMLSW